MGANVEASTTRGNLAQNNSQASQPIPNQPKTDPTTKLDKTLQDLATKGGSQAVTVYAVTTTGVSLAAIADSVKETRPYMDGQLVVAEVKASLLIKMAGIKGLIAAEAFKPIEPPAPLTPSNEDASKITPEQVQSLRARVEAAKAANDPASLNLPKYTSGAQASVSGPASTWQTNVDWIGAPAAWAKGYQGAGVNVAVIDSGVDFGNPDLMGRQATYPNSVPVYGGWPIALDPRSMREYALNGVDATYNYNNHGDRSWYARALNFLYAAKDTDGNLLDMQFNFNGSTYTIDKTIVAMSKSGKIRWGVHPDYQLYTYLAGWVPFILLDTTTAGVYDTVIADLNYDLWFDAHDVAASKAQPVLGQDLGHYQTADTLMLAGSASRPFGLDRAS
jgi:subtilisin family serine protease